MKRILHGLLIAILPACTHLQGSGPDTAAPTELWNRAHLSLAEENFQESRSVFQRLAQTFPEAPEGREAIFYLGTMHLDPRNPGWNPGSAEDRLAEYLALESEEQPVHRWPEARVLLQLAQQLNLPPEQRVQGLQPGTQVITVPQRIAPAAESESLAAEVQQLRRQLAERDAEIQRQTEELERIRRTLTPRTP